MPRFNIFVIKYFRKTLSEKFKNVYRIINLCINIHTVNVSTCGQLINKFVQCLYKANITFHKKCVDYIINKEKCMYSDHILKDLLLLVLQLLLLLSISL